LGGRHSSRGRALEARERVERRWTKDEEPSKWKQRELHDTDACAAVHTSLARRGSLNNEEIDNRLWATSRGISWDPKRIASCALRWFLSTPPPSHRGPPPPSQFHIISATLLAVPHGRARTTPPLAVVEFIILHYSTVFARSEPSKLATVRLRRAFALRRARLPPSRPRNHRSNPGAPLNFWLLSSREAYSPQAGGSFGCYTLIPLVDCCIAACGGLFEGT
jgi:hypothetical protein